MLIEKANHPIRTLEEWWQLAPPKSPEIHWQDGRSAKEVARAWLEALPGIPPEVDKLLKSNVDLAGIVPERVEPEALLPFDVYSGPRNADLAIPAHDTAGPVAITVEAKADEEFDDLIANTFSTALERLIQIPRSGGVARIISLAQSLFGPRGVLPSVVQLRYQLLTAAAGTMAFANLLKAERAVMVIHEFVTTRTSRRNLNRNHYDLEAFAKRVSGGEVTSVEAGRLYGPFRCPGEPLFTSAPRFYFGKAVRYLGEPGA
jgi:hypothetical protein